MRFFWSSLRSGASKRRRTWSLRPGSGSLSALAVPLVLGLFALLGEFRLPDRGAFAMMPGVLDRHPMQKPPYLFLQFSTNEDAKLAVADLNGKPFQGRKLWVTLDDVDASLTKVNVQGVQPSCSLEEVQDHFHRVGNVIDVRVYRDVMFALVRFEDPDAAWQAKMKLDGSVLRGKKLRVEIDCSDDYLTKILVHGISPRVDWLDLTNHFSRVGKVERAFIFGGRSARIRFENSGDANIAQSNLKWTSLPEFPGQKLAINFPWDGQSGGYEIIVRFPKQATRQQLVRHFGKVGKIESCVIEEMKLPPEFYLPVAPLPDPRSFSGAGGVVSMPR